MKVVCPVLCGIRARKAKREDAGLIANLRNAALRRLASAAYEPAIIERWIAAAGSPEIGLIERGRLHVLELGGEIVAAGGWDAVDRDQSEGGHSTAAIRSLAVAPVYARKGLGTLLMTLIEDEMAAQGFDRASIAASLSAMPLCTYRGFRPSRVLETVLPDGSAVTRVLMTKSLPRRLSAAA